MSKRNIILTGIIIVLVFVSFNVFFSGESADDIALVAASAEQRVESQVGADILAALNTLESLRLDVSFFKNDLYRNLRDQSQLIQPQPVGRNNPFLPIGRESGAAPVSTSTAR